MKDSKCVFVGNISYDVTEQEVIDLLVFDRDTGKPKGFGFCEYTDAETAQSAIRNLNDLELKGRRIRVDFAESDAVIKFGGNTDRGDRGGGDRAERGERPGPGMHVSKFQQDSAPMDVASRAAPQHNPYQAAGPVYGQAPPAGGPPAAESINTTLASMPPAQIFEFLKQMKQFITGSPEQARQTLMFNPQLAYALLQAQLQLGLVDPEVAKKMIASIPQTSKSMQPPSHSHGGPSFVPGPQAPPQMHMGGPPPNQPPPPSFGPQGMHHQAPPSQGMGMMPGQHMGHMGGMGGAPSSQQNMPPMNMGQMPAPSGMMHQSAPLMAGPPPPPMGGGAPMTQEHQLLMQLMALTPQQIDMLPPDQRAAVHALRSQVGAQ
ncbi:hypothetical protein CAOG_003500 [Capsaspora owczarzaki ATCC 30864]|uniref:RRM domain-containing protein n=1 Tax=Capsaspora owczarzaki (strain ATCC 30864) TaxID=595528 RepID=A0A0D2X2H2_CAPO3|nr:hypothetical protein CAOG_003500 [Capsaspora owczarzaki ATCC 30864]